MALIGYTIEEDSCEVGLLFKYLDISESLISKEDLQKILETESSDRVIVVGKKLSLYKSLILNSKRQICLIHLGDEHYKFLDSLVYLDKNIIMILRNHNVAAPSTIFIALLKWPVSVTKWILAYWLQDQSLTQNIHHAVDSLLSIKILIRQFGLSLVTKLKGKNKVVFLPLNEPDFFFQATNKSLPTSKDIQVSFAGGLHSHERRTAHKSAVALGYSHGYDGWAWKAKNTLSPVKYYQILVSSKFVLSPNGHSSQDCFRFYETVRAGALPLISAETPFQPFGYLSNLFNLDRRLLLKNFSSNEVLKSIESIDPSEYTRLLDSLVVSIDKTNKYAKNIIHSACLDSSQGNRTNRFF